ncbi:snRNA-activating protein complex subunit 3 [Nilaparvata lugens]|uniref:snRNA-activating protein complex subunit 3 n=1 Tax=Nilaparvata lugens TaxID=108931 RepID=UPI00193DD71A|nr:snRNA-activating protein complex subunit 3 [Nilaparvata lugens]
MLDKDAYRLMHCETHRRNASSTQDDRRSRATNWLSSRRHDESSYLLHVSAALDLYPSSMFFINETFYVDFSQPCDYSTVVKEWALSGNIKVNPDTKDMAATRISDLTVELDYPYLFQHLGNCEHLIEFSGGRILLAQRDSLCSAHYPWSRKDYITKGKYCIICNIHIPTRKVIGCARLPRHNSYLCEECFQRYCYIRNKKVGSFEAYHFKDKRATISGY